MDRDAPPVPQDRTEEQHPRTGTRKKIVIALTVIVALLVSLGVAELAGRFVSRAVDATGLTCGRDYEVMKASELKDFRLYLWGSPQEVADARVSRFSLTPADLRNAPPGLGRPTIVTPPREDPWEKGPDRYRPLLFALDDSTVVQGDGLLDRTYVVADARTGAPLWGVRVGASIGWGASGGRMQLIETNTKSTSSITTLDPRTGDRLSCRRFDEGIDKVAGAGDELWVQTEANDDKPSEIIRYNGATGELVAAARAPESEFSERVPVGDRIAFTPTLGAFVHREDGSEDAPQIAPLIWFNPASGLLQRFKESYRQAVVRPVNLADGSVGTLLAEFENKRAWQKQSMRYRLLDAANETMWTVDARAHEKLAIGIDQSWQSGDLLILNDADSVFAVSIATGKRLWSRDNPMYRDHAALIGAEKKLLATGQTDGAADEPVTTVIDPVTGTSKNYSFPLERLRGYSDNYVIVSDLWRDIVFWRGAQ